MGWRLRYFEVFLTDNSNASSVSDFHRYELGHPTPFRGVVRLEPPTTRLLAVTYGVPPKVRLKHVRPDEPPACCEINSTKRLTNAESVLGMVTTRVEHRQLLP